ncbi:MAG TPA: hypothetical protein VGG27_08545 [Magnetospirillaceae bacterium]
MAETQKTDARDAQTMLPHVIGTKFIDSAETVLHAQAELLSDMEDTLLGTLRAQQESLQKILDLVGEARSGGTLADQLKLHMAVSEHCFNTGLAFWRDTTAKLSQQTLKRFEATRKSATDAADETRRAGWGVVDKAASTAKSTTRRAAEAA